MLFWQPKVTWERLQTWDLARCVEKMSGSQAKCFSLWISSLSLSFCLCLDLILLSSYSVTVFNLNLNMVEIFFSLFSLYPCPLLTRPLCQAVSQFFTHSLTQWWGHTGMGSWQNIQKYWHIQYLANINMIVIIIV